MPVLFRIFGAPVYTVSNEKTFMQRIDENALVKKIRTPMRQEGDPVGGDYRFGDKRMIAKGWFDNVYIFTQMRSGKIIGCPLFWFPRLLNATPGERLNFKLEHAGFYIRWPELNEDLSAEGMYLYEASPLPPYAPFVP